MCFENISRRGRPAKQTFDRQDFGFVHSRDCSTRIAFVWLFFRSRFARKPAACLKAPAIPTPRQFHRLT